jgi:hypothetical protein
VSRSLNKHVPVWDATSDILTLPSLRGHGNASWMMVFSPAGSQIVSKSMVDIYGMLELSSAIFDVQAVSSSVRLTGRPYIPVIS